MVIAILSLAQGRRKGILVCLLLAVLLAGCGLGGNSSATVTTGLITATATRATTPSPTTVAPTATHAATATPPALPSTTALATPTMMLGHTATIPATAPVPTPTSPTTPQASATPGVVEVRIIDFAFDPPVVEIPVGTTVTWRLVQGYHTVATADFMLNSPPLENVGDTYSFTFTVEGTYDYICGIHPEMLGQVRVVR